MQRGATKLLVCRHYRIKLIIFGSFFKEEKPVLKKTLVKSCHL